jgi:peptidoglycan/xylan/chitin deacetylase (PgdA/CDA1 family)
VLERWIDTGPLVVRLGQILLPGCLWHGDRSRAVVALTFDDGPDPEHTPTLLDVLARHQVRATFFWIGWRVRRSPELARRVISNGHAIGLHGERHQSWLARGADDVLAELEGMRAVLEQELGLPGPWIARPPFGWVRPSQVRRLSKAGYRVVECDVLPGDWATPANVVVERVARQARNGSIVALHDGNTAGPQVAETADHIITHLGKRGFGFVTVGELA